MSKYTLWDIPSSTLLLDTDIREEISTATEAFVRENGIDVLDELLLGVERKGSKLPVNHTGTEILTALNAPLSVTESGRSGHVRKAS